MKSGPVIVLMVAAISWPAVAQRDSTHGSGFGNRGSGGHASYSGRPGFTGHQGFVSRGKPEPGGYAPAAPFKYGSLGPPPAVRFNPPHISAPGFAGGRSGFMTSRPTYRADFAGRDGSWDRNRNGAGDHRRDRDGDHDGDRDRFRGRARSFENWYLFSSPEWLGYGYPYVLDPAFYDWSDYGNSGSNQDEQNNQVSGYNNEGPPSQPESRNGDLGEPGNGSGSESFGEPGGAYGQSGEQPPPWPEPPPSQTAPDSHFSVSGQSAAIAPPLEGPLTVIFKGGRAPEQMQNYMLTAKAITDLDADHYEQIPLEQIDITATVSANRASGLQFRVPGAPRD